MTDRPDLLPCPLCRGEARLVEQSPFSETYFSPYIDCGMCWLCLPAAEGLPVEQLIAAWNRRTLPAAVREVIEAARDGHEHGWSKERQYRLGRAVVALDEEPE